MGGQGSGGGNKKTAQQKIAEGNRGRRDLDRRKPVALPGEPAMPSSLNAQGKKVWPEVCRILESNGVLFQADSFSVAALCSNLVHFTKLDAVVAKAGIKGMTTYGSSGNLMTHPHVRMRDAAFKALRASWQGFGLDPVSRDGLDVAKKPKDDQPETAMARILRSKNADDEVVH